MSVAARPSKAIAAILGVVGLKAFARLSQVAVAVPIHVQCRAVQHHPDALLTPGSEDQEGVTRLILVLGFLPRRCEVPRSGLSWRSTMEQLSFVRRFFPVFITLARRLTTARRRRWITAPKRRATKWWLTAAPWRGHLL